MIPSGRTNVLEAEHKRRGLMVHTYWTTNVLEGERGLMVVNRTDKRDGPGSSNAVVTDGGGGSAL